MSEQRSFLKPGTRIRLECGNSYEITGTPVGSGGGSLLYPAERIYEHNGNITRDGIAYVLKECYPLSDKHHFVRDEYGEVIPADESSSGAFYLNRVREMQMDEKRITQKIYLTGSRLLPILEANNTVTISTTEGNSAKIHNTFTVMESLSAKGKSLSTYIKEYERLTPLQTFHIVQQILFSLREIHNSGFVHLDIQDNNIFIKGTLDNESGLVTLIDFGSARELYNGKTKTISDKVIFTTRGFSAPEILLHNDGQLQLGPEADIYSVGCLILYLLTGSRFDANYLIQNTSGKYLTRFKLRKISCPRHLINRMQEIIAHALSVNPEDRYHSADEMLNDVSDYVKALQPYRSDLNSVSFDAFICYKHNPLDSTIAASLQKRLEHFRTPHGISGERRPFKRVFIDEGELSSCADFGEQIRSALKNSGWLIVICSPDTPSSPWVNLEIDTFLEYHDRSRILAVLTDGEPETAFPSQLSGTSWSADEVLAADARGKDLRNVLLKLAAPMLGTTYDSLKQRHKVYRLQKASILVSLCMTLAILFSIYAVRQNQKINAELENTLIIQSQYLAQKSGELLNSGDRVGAIQTALDALPDGTNDNSRPIVPEALYALNNATYTYWSASFNDFIARCQLKTVTPPKEDTTVISPDGQFLACIDASGKLYIFHREKDLLLYSLHPSDLISDINGSRFCHADFLTETTLILTLSEQLICWDFSENEILWKKEFKSSFDLLTYLSDDRESLYLFADLGIEPIFYKLSTEDGSILKSIALTDSDFRYSSSYQDVTAFSVSDNGKYVLIGMACQNKNHSEEHDSLFLLDLDTQNMQTCSSACPDVYDVHFLDNDHFIVLSSSNVTTTYNPEFWNYTIEYVNLADQTVKWSGRDKIYAQDPMLYLFFDRQAPEPSKSPQNLIITIAGNQIVYRNPDDGTEYANVAFSNNIINACHFADDRLLITLADGSVYQLVNGSTFYNIGNASGNFSNAYYYPASTEFGDLYLVSKDETFISVLSNRMEDTNYTPLDINEPCDIYYGTAGNRTYRVINTETKLKVYDILQDTPTAECDSSWEATILGFNPDSEKADLFYIYDNALYQLNIPKNTSSRLCEMPTIDDYIHWEIIGWNKDCCIIWDSFDKTFFSINVKTLKKTSIVCPEDYYFHDFITYSNNGKYIAAIVNPSSDYDGTPLLILYDLSKEEWMAPELDMDLTQYNAWRYYDYDCLAFSEDGSLLSLVSNGEIVILDTKTLTITKTLKASCTTQCSMQFIDNNTLAVLDDSNKLTIWDVNEQKIFAESSETLPRLNELVLKILNNEYICVSSSDSNYNKRNYIYHLDAVGSLTPYLTLRDCFVDIEHGEILFGFSERSNYFLGYYSLYSFDELINRAKTILSGQASR